MIEMMWCVYWKNYEPLWIDTWMRLVVILRNSTAVCNVACSTFARFRCDEGIAEYDVQFVQCNHAKKFSEKLGKLQLRQLLSHYGKIVLTKVVVLAP